MKENDCPLNNRVALITGAGGGIGSDICYEFARLGSTVYMVDINDTNELADKIYAEVGGVRPISLICDIANKEQVKAMIDTIQNSDSGIDILINNAAIKGPNGPHTFPEMTLEGFKSTIDIDLSAAVYLSILVLPYMQKQKWGRVIFTAAPRSSSGIPSPYLAGKSGFIGLAKSLSSIYDGDGIKTLSLALRHTETPMIRRVIASKGIDVEEGLRKMNEKSLTGKMITPKEIAKLYAFFAQSDNSEVSSVSLLSDGGITYLR
jgi:NAD(P)-dependent dehydrogenase (short-subunit alcohol dehydrogenase family)